SRAALQEQQPRQVGAGLVGAHDLAGEDLDLLAVWLAVVKRHGEYMVGQHCARLAKARHTANATGVARCSKVVAMGAVTRAGRGIRTVTVAERRGRGGG